MQKPILSESPLTILSEPHMQEPPKKDQKPVIALTPYHNTETDEPYMRPTYLKAILAAGGIPVILPLDISQAELSQLVSMFDAFLFCGGPDIHPFHFDENTHIHCGNVSAKRDSLELTLLRLAMEAQKPILGICRGIQLINIGIGGNIYQDISSQHFSSFPIAHVQPFGYEIPSHTVTVLPGTLLEHICNYSLQSSSQPSCPYRLQVNSMHHQAIRRLAPGLAASAYASDGLVEAIEYPEYPAFFLGVQWHPEYLWTKDTVSAEIFRKFTLAAGLQNGDA